MNSNAERRPLVSEVPAIYQMEYAAYLQSRRSNYGTSAAWLAWRRAASEGVAVKVQSLSPGTSRSDAQPVMVEEQAMEHLAKTEPVSVTDLGQRPVSAVWPRHGVAMPDEALHKTSKEPVTKSSTERKDF